ncbi:cell division protein FtsI (penicillin-binding protein 3) [Kineosphaera limosa]|uniref:Cell division protein FtsI n=1 Tax=Kineosphaera limosa NBRC 100340 TaxID=1184609 RepID=K6WAS7_9MICO|nr:penicillin-binding protein 2 [Kineosphaera limosa]NYD99267.1 cell division protein FtsI (penicillin-binding protein 3) [Kineosphaera limosa]GAB96305.1 cell division protein FtsI [Kineosphaera limosa NBRC 100340]
MSPSDRRSSAPRPQRAAGPQRGPARSPRSRIADKPLLVNPRARVRVMFLAVLFVFTLFAAQLVRLQAIDAREVAEQARDLRMGTETTIPAKRGAMLDRDGVTLAGSVERRDIVADQTQVPDFKGLDPKPGEQRVGGVDGAAAALAPILKQDEATLKEKLTGERRWIQLSLGQEPSVWRQVQALRIDGIASEQVSRRVYPAGAPLAPVLGWVGSDGEARGGSGGGLELLFNETLTGTPGKSRVERSADNRVIPMGESEVTPAVPGQSLQLSLDNDLSWYAYNAIADRVKATDADSGTVVVMDTKGRLRAVTQFPSFDPTDRNAKGSEFSSLPFQQVFEPGSTAKVMSLGAALDTGAVTPTTGFTVPNRLTRADRSFRDSHDHPTLQLTTAGVLAQSSNIGTLLAAEKVDPATLEKYYRSFGLGQRSGVGFPGESSGLIKPSAKWDAAQRYTVMFGQGMSVTAIQDAGVFQTIANGGVRIPPTLVEGVKNADGSSTPQPLPEGTRVISEQTATDLSVMLESVVGESGTAQQAAIAGIPVAGKTGTAERYDPTVGRYQGYTASFVGFAPADKPELVVAVILQNPKKGYYGGTTAGPVFQQVMSYALQKYGIPPTGVQRTPFPLKVGEKPATDPEKVDPSLIGPGGTSGSGTPTAPRVAVTTSAPTAESSGTQSQGTRTPPSSATGGATAGASGTR